MNINYERMRKIRPQQKAALTRAIKTKDPERVIEGGGTLMKRSILFRELARAYDQIEDSYYSGESTYEQEDLNILNKAAELLLSEDEYCAFIGNEKGE